MGMRATGTGFAALAPVVLTALLPTLLGCKDGGGLPELEGGVEIGLRRGAAWSTYKVKPPNVIGPYGTLRLEKNVLTGILQVYDPDAWLAESGTMRERWKRGGKGINITVTPDGASGMAPFGNVSLDLEDGPDSLTVEGLWNGSRVHFRITAESFRGTIAVVNGRTLASVVNCQYVLDRVEPDGSRSGISTCTGMPEQTRLEVPSAVQAWLTRSELMVLLMALLSVPPDTMTDIPVGDPYER